MVFLYILVNNKPRREYLNAYTRNWYTDGYRTSAPGTNTCREDSDCEGNEACQSGFCAGIRRKYSLYGLYFGNEYQRFLGGETPYDTSVGTYNPTSYLHSEPGGIPTNFDYDYS